jgi:Protein of unknown function (DUF2934)
MIEPKIRTQPKPNIVIAPKSSPGNNAMMPDPVASQETAKIRERAYELYERRGRNPGYDQQDWLRAEQEILKGKR